MSILPYMSIILLWSIAKHVGVFPTLIIAAMISKHSEVAKRQAWDWYGRFASPSSHTAPPPSCQEVGSSSHYCTAPPSRMQEVGSSSHCCTAPPPSHQEEASSDHSMEMWVVAPPPLACLVAPPLTRLEVASSSIDSPSDSSGYNDECPHVKKVSSYELLLDFNCLVQ
jgi:hypothetical protein